MYRVQMTKDYLTIIQRLGNNSRPDELSILNP